MMNRNFITTLFLAITLLTSVVSCNLNSDDDIELSSDCIISSMTLGSLKRIMHTKTELGKDSTYEVNVNGAYYPLTIDHLNGKIFNTDSLPKGTDMTRVTLNAMNASGTVMIRSILSGQDTVYVASDSTDFTMPRLLTVYAKDGKSKRSYEVMLNVHKEDADSIVWHNVAQGQETLVQMQQPRALYANSRINVWGNVSGVSTMLTIPLNGTQVADVAQWQTFATDTPLQPRSLQYYNEKYYALSASGKLLASVDGAKWQQLNTSFSPKALVAVGSAGLVALGDDTYYSSLDGETWQALPIDRPEMLPQEGVSAACVMPADGKSEEVYVLAGVRNGQNVVWRRWVNPTYSEDFPWINLQMSETNKYSFPALHDYTLVAYDKATYMIGMTEVNAKSSIYTSQDNGRTWVPDVMKLPKNTLLNLQNQCTGVALAVDNENFLWLFSAGDGQVWRGRYYRLGWK